MNDLAELQVVAKAEYASLTEDEQRAVDLRWEDVPEHVKDRIRDEAELDLL